MEPRFEERPALRLMGLQKRIRLDSADWGALWGEYHDRYDELAPLAVDPGCYGAYFGAGEEGVVDFLMASAAGPEAALPAGLTVQWVPPARWAVFECGMPEIGATWHAIYSEWLPSSGLLERADAPAMEYFAPDAHTGASPVRILVPVEEAP